MGDTRRGDQSSRVEPSGVQDLLAPILARAGRGRQSIITTDFVCVYALRTSWPPSRPHPDCLYPPKGSEASRMLKQLTQTVPAWIFFAKVWALDTSLVQIPADRP